MADNEERTTKENESNPKKKKSPIVLILIIVVLLAVIGGAVAFFVLGKKDDAGAKKEASTEVSEENAKLEVYEFDTFVVNLAKASNFLRTTILVEYDPSVLSGGDEEDKEEKGGEGEVDSKSLPKLFEKRDAMIRDAIISTLSYKTPNELLTQEGKEALKEELVNAINEALGLEESVVVSVYFKDFIMQ